MRALGKSGADMCVRLFPGKDELVMHRCPANHGYIGIILKPAPLWLSGSGCRGGHDGALRSDSLLSPTT